MRGFFLALCLWFVASSGSTYAQSNSFCGKPGEHPGCEIMLKELDAASAENNPQDRALASTATTHAGCISRRKESMSALIKRWKQKVAALRAKKDPNPEFNAAKLLWIQFRNIETAFQRCMQTPLHKVETPNLKTKF